jgi:hypothetical protein
MNKPQLELLFDHLVSLGSISPYEAQDLYNVHAFHRRMADLRDMGVKFTKEASATTPVALRQVPLRRDLSDADHRGPRSCQPDRYTIELNAEELPPPSRGSATCPLLKMRLGLRAPTGNRPL